MVNIQKYDNGIAVEGNINADGSYARKLFLFADPDISLEVQAAIANANTAMTGNLQSQLDHATNQVNTILTEAGL